METCFCIIITIFIGLYSQFHYCRAATAAATDNSTEIVVVSS